MIRECLKIAEDDNELYEKLIVDIATFKIKMTSMALKKTNKVTSGLSVRHSSKSRKTRDKRKGHC